MERCSSKTFYRIIRGDNLANETDHDHLIAIRSDLKNIKEDVTEIKATVKAQNGRVRKLEIHNAFIWGSITVIGIGVPLLFKYVF